MSRIAQPQHRPTRAARSGRWSPPLWGCYEYQTDGSEHDSECETCSGSEDESSSEEQRNESGSGSGSSESDGDDKRTDKRKGKQPQPIRRKERREPVYRPILTIRRSEGFVWNQDLFLPSYIRDRYVATSPNSSYTSGNTSTCDSSFSGMDFEIECVDIHVDGKGILSGLSSTPNKDEQSS